MLNVTKENEEYVKQYYVNSYYNVLNNYYSNNNLSYTVKGNLEEYMNFVLEEYIENGCYKENHNEVFIEAISRYEEISKKVL